jgi:predicted methyltransferase
MSMWSVITLVYTALRARYRKRVGASFGGSLARIGVALFLAALLGAPACSHAQNSGPERDAWQRPGDVLDELGIQVGSVVADVGCGRGYFTFKLAERVGPQGKVYAEDIDNEALDSIRLEAKKKGGLTQVLEITGTEEDVNLPPSRLDVALAVNTFHEWKHYDQMLQGVFKALKPGGLFGLIDRSAETGHPRDYYYDHHRMPKAIEREDVTQSGFRFLREERGFTRPDDHSEFYFLVFEKPLAQ